MFNQALVLVVSFLAALLLVPVAIRLAGRLDFLDYPRGNKSHTRPVPLLGGVVVFLGLSSGLGLSLAMGWLEVSKTLIGFCLSGAAILVLGLVDDKLGLSPPRKLAGQLAVVLFFFIFYDQSLTSFSFPLGFLLLLVWVVGLVNALNFLDNMDGLCSGVSLVASLAFAVLAYLEGKTLLLVIGLSLAGSLLAFLKFNLSPAKIFLGDAGSMLNGFTLAVLGMLFISEIRTQYAVLVPLLILSYPIFDISFVTFTRLKQGKKIYRGGLDHSSHRLVRLGITSGRAVWGILIISLFLAVTGVLTFYYLDSPVKILVPLAIAFGLTLFGIHLHRNFLNFKEKLLLIGLDLLIVNLSFLAVWQLGRETGLQFLGLPGLEMGASTIAILLNFYWLNLFAVAGLYEFYWGMLLREEIKAILKTVLGGGAILFFLAAGTVLGSSKFSLMLLSYVFLILAGLTIFRVMVILFQRRLGRVGKFSQPAVIVGTERNAVSVWEDIHTRPGRGLKIVGFIDENHSQSELEVPCKVLGKLENLEETLRRNRVREVLIAVEPNWPGSLDEVLDKAQNLEVNFRVKSELLPRVRGRKITPLSEGSFYKVYPSQMRTWEWGAKRLADLFVSLTVILLTLPVQVFLAIQSGLIKGENPFESQTILGKKGKIVKVVQFKSKPKASLWHKLPLLLSLLKGDLSLIGPAWVALESGEHPQLLYSIYEDKLKVRPGLINPDYSGALPADGNGNSSGAEPGDLVYIENMSFISDLRVLLKSLARPISKLIL